MEKGKKIGEKKVKKTRILFFLITRWTPPWYFGICSINHWPRQVWCQAPRQQWGMRNSQRRHWIYFSEGESLFFADDRSWPDSLIGRFHNDSGVNSSAKNVVKVVNHARDQWDDEDKKQKGPNASPAFPIGQSIMMEPVRRSPQSKSYRE